jgi:hypothetical protein
MATTHEQTLLEVLGLEDLLPEEQEELLLDLNELIFKGAMVRLIERMDDATKADFDALMESEADEEEVEAFLMERVPDADEAVQETVDELKNDILSVTGVSQD